MSDLLILSQNVLLSCQIGIYIKENFKTRLNYERRTIWIPQYFFLVVSKVIVKAINLFICLFHTAFCFDSYLIRSLIIMGNSIPPDCKPLSMPYCFWDNTQMYFQNVCFLFTHIVVKIVCLPKSVLILF